MLLNEILGEAKQQFKSRVPEHAQTEIFGLIHGGGNPARYTVCGRDIKRQTLH